MISRPGASSERVEGWQDVMTGFLAINTVLHTCQLSTYRLPSASSTIATAITPAKIHLARNPRVLERSGVECGRLIAWSFSCVCRLVVV